MKKQKSKHPDWVLAQRKAKTEVRFLNGTYYLYEATSKWDPQKKRSQKISGKLLGKITPEGFVESDKYKLRQMSKPVLKTSPSIKEYGSSHLALTLFSEEADHIKSYFGELWQEIVSLALIRLIHQAPIKNTGFCFETSYLSELYNGITLGEKRTSALYRKFGTIREQVVSYMKTLVKEGDHILIDATNIISHSEQIGISHLGYNSKKEYDPQINIMLMFSSRMQMPVYYRVIPGNIREVSAFKKTLDECGVSNVTIVADKGFYSEENVNTLEGFNAKYIIPLRRSSGLINYGILKDDKAIGYFEFQKRYIWYCSYKVNHRTIHLYLDNDLMAREEADYLSRIKTLPEKYSFKDFMERKHKFGTIAMITNKTDIASEQIYQDYKVRNQIETMIDAMKNTLMADSSYMQNEDAFNGWMFINFIALQFYYKLCMLLREKNLLCKYSPSDLLMHLQSVRKAKINGQWITCEINGKTSKLLDKLSIQPIT